MRILIAIDGELAQRRFALPSGRSWCGRPAPGIVIGIPGPGISRRHALLESREEGVRITDVGSANGTWVNGVRLAINQPLELRHLDRLRIGTQFFRFESDEMSTDAVIGPGTGVRMARSRVQRGRTARRSLSTLMWCGVGLCLLALVAWTAAAGRSPAIQPALAARTSASVATPLRLVPPADGPVVVAVRTVPPERPAPVATAAIHVSPPPKAMAAVMEPGNDDPPQPTSTAADPAVAATDSAVGRVLGALVPPPVATPAPRPASPRAISAPATDLGMPLPWTLPKPALARASFTPAIAPRAWNKRGDTTALVPLQYAEAIRKAKSEAEVRRLCDEAIAIFLPDDCPLPRTLDGAPPAVAGKPYPDHWYHSHLGGDDLMWALLDAYRRTSHQEYLVRVIAFAETMISHGRDRYGSVRGPLFASLLIRGPQPHIPDPPVIRGLRNANFPTITWQGGHKAAYNGANLSEDEELYRLLYQLSEITASTRYAKAADAAIAWWLANCPSRVNGLLPWGEHSGWDFISDTVSDDLHENAGGTWLLKERFFALQPPLRSGGISVMEGYALGLFGHFTTTPDGMAIYCRHGSLSSPECPADKRTFGMFSKHLGGWRDIWILVYARSENPVFKQRFAARLRPLLEGLHRQVDRWGCLPYIGEIDRDGVTREKDTSHRPVTLRGLDLVMQVDFPELAARIAELETRSRFK